MSAADKTKLDAISGTNTGDQTITLTGDVTGSGTGSFATAIGAGKVTLAMQANMASASVVYRKTAGAGAPEVQSLATLKTDLGLTGTNSGDQTSIVGITGTKAQFDTAVTDGDFLYVGAISDAAYAGSWNGSLLAPTQNAVHDKIETLQPLDADLTAIAALVTTAFGRDHLVLADAAALRTKAGLGTAAVKNTGVSGDAVPVLNGAATTWAAGSTFQGTVLSNGANGIVQAKGSTAGSASLRMLSSSGDAAAYFDAQINDQSAYANLYIRASNIYLAPGGSATVQTFAGGLSITGSIVASTSVEIPNGTQVVGGRKTGWTADTGTAKRTANATYSGTAEAAYTQATIQTLMDAVRDQSQALKALKDDLINHGLIGA